MRSLFPSKVLPKNTKNLPNNPLSSEDLVTPSLKPSKDNNARKESARKLEEIIKMLDKKYPGNVGDNYFEELDNKEGD